VPRVPQDRLDARRRQILDGARVCFARYGYEGATVRRLEEETGLSRGAIFHHFRDKESLFLALARDDAERMADVVAQQGLVQVMRDLLAGREQAVPARPDGLPDGGGDVADWLGTRLEVSRRLRTDPEFRARWSEQAAQLSSATLARLRRRAGEGDLRSDVPLPVLVAFLELVLEGLVAHLAMGMPTGELDSVLDLVEETVRRH
jgi:AcrR family transcriptional regulator